MSAAGMTVGARSFASSAGVSGRTRTTTRMFAPLDFTVRGEDRGLRSATDDEALSTDFSVGGHVGVLDAEDWLGDSKSCGGVTDAFPMPCTHVALCDTGENNLSLR